jgi:inosine-uridine nucleoside N-ribohydrolase
MSAATDRPPARRRRVIINTDAKNEADDQYAIVHALLTPMFDLRGLVAAHWGHRRSHQSMQDSRDEIDRLLDLMRLTGTVTVANGAAEALADEQTANDSPGAQLIIEQSKDAITDDPLYVAFLGPLTDMASAILIDPGIVRRPVVVIWIGGLDHDERPSGHRTEFNLSNDIAAANVVFNSGITVWQVPSSIYTKVSVSYAELADKIGGTSELADYLIGQMIDWNATWHGEPIESRSLGDSPAIALMMFPASGTMRTVPAPRFGPNGEYLVGSGHPIRVCTALDVRFLLEDMFAKLRRFGRDVGR